MDTLTAKEKNALRVRRYRERQKELLGKEAFNKKEAEARKERRHLQKERELAILEKEKKAQQKQTLTKQTALLKGSNMVADIFSSILNSIPKEKPKTTNTPKVGRKIIYVRKEEMTKKEERAVASREKKREYMREYMRKYNEEKRKNKQQQS